MMVYGIKKTEAVLAKLDDDCSRIRAIKYSEIFRSTKKSPLLPIFEMFICNTLMKDSSSKVSLYSLLDILNISVTNIKA